MNSGLLQDLLLYDKHATSKIEFISKIQSAYGNPILSIINKAIDKLYPKRFEYKDATKDYISLYDNIVNMEEVVKEVEKSLC